MNAQEARKVAEEAIKNIGKGEYVYVPHSTIVVGRDADGWLWVTDNGEGDNLRYTKPAAVDEIVSCLTAAE